MAAFHRRLANWIINIVRMPNRVRQLSEAVKLNELIVTRQSEIAADILRALTQLDALSETLVRSGAIADMNRAIVGQSGLLRSLSDAAQGTRSHMLDRLPMLVQQSVGARMEAHAVATEAALGRRIEAMAGTVNAALGEKIGGVPVTIDAMVGERIDAVAVTIDGAIDNKMAALAATVKASLEERVSALGARIDGELTSMQVEAGERLMALKGQIRRDVCQETQELRGTLLSRADADRRGLLGYIDAAAPQASRGPDSGPSMVAAPQSRRTPEEVMARLASRYSVAFPLWKQLFDAGAEEYRVAPTLSLSVKGHEVADRFEKYLMEFARGRLLDVGCGPQPVPVYLADYPLELVAGCDPLPPTSEHPFEFCHAVGEDLPWPDGSFDTVSVGTSLDHAIHLEDTLKEISRVLVPGGRVILWVGFVPGAKRYNPAAPGEVADTYHLYHLDQGWFEELMADRFEFCDRLNVRGDQWFYFYRTPRSRLQYLK